MTHYSSYCNATPKTSMVFRMILNNRLVIYFCVTNYPQTQPLKTTSNYYFAIAMDQKFGSGLEGWYWRRMAHESAITELAAVISSLDWDWRICFQAHLCLTSWTSPEGCLMTWHCFSPDMQSERGESQWKP